MKFVIETNLASQPAWWLVDDDEDRVLAWAGRTFVSLAYADQAAHDFRVNADDPDYRGPRPVRRQVAVDRLALVGDPSRRLRRVVLQQGQRP
jgi:hypothetical protein